MWSIGTSMLTVIMGHMANSQDMLAAHSLIGNVDRLSTVVCFGVSGASAIMVGKEIGMGRSKDRVYSVGWTLLMASLVIGTAVMGILLLLLPTFFQPVLFRIFDLSAGATEAAVCMTIIYALSMPMRAFDITNITGVLRAGGDAKTATMIDITPLWLVAIPVMALTALVLDAPVFWVCLAMQSENLLKCPLGILRIRSKKWITDVTRTEI